MKQAFLTLALLLNSFILNQLAAQSAAAHVAGDLLVSLHPGATAEQVAEAANRHFTEKAANMAVVKKVADPMNIWLLHSDLTGEGEELRMLALVRGLPGVAVAQFNHITTERGHFDPDLFSKEINAAREQLFSKRKAARSLATTIPNDPNFGQQWQYINDGSSAGTVDADLDIELAWDVTTGGLTPLGDTIVVCVVDGGVNTAHPDLAANIWKNWADIPNNGIDDDGNGYVDDHRGWSTYSNTDAITGNAGHGTCVAGIIGAVGNNSVGVSGVNWQVKVMVVAGGSGTEANAIAGYAYPYSFRKKYNETGGAAGAFVVATNSSWGVDLGQPADAPLWCAFYDTLGKVGILSCGATANANFNIDTQGDLPTGCASDWLISVTNCGRNGKKVTSAGYGATTIDLGSFGQDAYTLSQSGYAGFGGTSGATPHVTGAIALLYSAPCTGFAAKSQADPAQAALDLKGYILGSTDPEPTLDGKTVTGGRLNIDKAMTKLLAEGCSACPPPFSVKTDGITKTEASISFNQLDAAAPVNLRWAEAGSGNWTVEPGVASPFLLKNLTACTDYEVQLEMACADSTSGWSASKPFKTDGCCTPVAGLAVSNLTNNGATFSWQPVTAAAHYVVELHSAVGVMAIVVDSAATGFSAAGLLPACTEFDLYVRTQCAGGLDLVSGPVSFKTKGCGVCEDAPYCSVTAPDASEEWIEGVEFAGINHLNTAGSTGYEKEDDAATVEQYHTYPIKLTPGWVGNPFNEYFRAWIDWNQDGQFTDPAERVFDSGTAQQVPVGGDVTVGNVPTGTTRLRVAMKYIFGNAQKPQPCTAFQYGQVKDFCVEVKAGVPDCAVPPVFGMVTKSGTTATVSWSAVPFATEYLLKINEKGSATAQEFTTATNQYTFTNLLECTEYEAHVRPKCGTVEQTGENLLLFKTDCNGVATGNLSELAGVEVSPNPFSEKLTISLESEKTGEATVELFAPSGQLVESQRFAFAAGRNLFSLEAAGAAAGSYFLRIKTEEGVAVRRVFKQ